MRNFKKTGRSILLILIGIVLHLTALCQNAEPLFPPPNPCPDPSYPDCPIDDYYPLLLMVVIIIAAIRAWKQHKKATAVF